MIRCIHTTIGLQLLHRCMIILSIMLSQITHAMAGNQELMPDTTGMYRLQEAQCRICDTIFSDTVFFRLASSRLDPDFSDNRKRIENIRKCISSLNDTSENLIFHITGSVSPEGTPAFNNTLAAARAHKLDSLIRKYTEAVPSVNIIIPPIDSKTDYKLLRNSRLAIISLTTPPQRLSNTRLYRKE